MKPLGSIRWIRWTSRLLACCAAAFLTPAPVFAAVSVADDTGRTVTLSGPASRIVSLAPHTTELLFAAGAGARIVGVTEYSDFPPEARRIASVGSGVALDLERIVALKPDLVVGWNSGNAAAQLARLDALGIPVFRSEPRDFATIASSLERLAHLAGSDATGHAAAKSFRARQDSLQGQYQGRRPVSVFYQIWRAPLMTLNGTHIVSAGLRICGGENIFAGLPQLVPTVTVEAVLNANPEAIIASSGAKDDAFAIWRRFPNMKAVARNNLISIDGELLNRPGPRILDGTEALCKKLDEVRTKH